MENLLQNILEKMETGFENMNHEINKLNEKIVGLDERITGEIGKLDNRMTLIEAKLIEEHELTREELKHEIQNTYTELDTLKSDFTTVKIVTADNMKSIAKMERKEQKN